MRLVIMSDIHGNLPALEAVLRDSARHAADAVINLGDCVTGPLWPRETLEMLQSLALPTVRGNHDRWLREPPAAWTEIPPSVAYVHEQLDPAQLDWLATRPARLDLDDDVLAVHGCVNDDTSFLLEEAIDGRLALLPQGRLAARLDGVGAGARLILCGHSHVQHSAMSRGRLVVNPGSVGCPRYADNADPSIAEPGVLMAQYGVATRRGTRWSTDLCSVPYDTPVVVERARTNGRQDWAAAFLGDSG
jgi:predicted phosphodiesterase